jgi:hypothetical protein
VSPAHSGIALVILEMGMGQGNINDGSLLHGHAVGLEMCCVRLIDLVFCETVPLLAEIVLLQQVTED